MPSLFRCVDEINQGLHGRNVSFVFQRLLQTLPEPSPDDHCGQQLRINPVLLPNLDGIKNDNITIFLSLVDQTTSSIR